MNFRIKERDEFEFYLNQQAQKGYKLKWFNEYVLCFEKSVDLLHYYVDYNPNYKFNAHRAIDDEEQKKIAFYKDMGLDFVTLYDCFIVFSSKEEFTKFHSDVSIVNDIIEKTKKRMKNARVFSLALLAFVLYVKLDTVIDMMIHVPITIMLSLIFIIVEVVFMKHYGITNKSIEIIDDINKIQKRTYLFLVGYITMHILLFLSLMFSYPKVALKSIIFLATMYLFRFLYTSGLSVNDSFKKIIIVLIILIGYIITLIFIL